MSTTLTIYQRMDALFKAANVPGYLQQWRRTEEHPTLPDKYCTYLVAPDRPALCADNDEIIHVYNVLVHIYGKTDPTPEAAALVKAAKAAGFCVPSARDVPDVRAGEYQYHRRVDLAYYEDLQDYGGDDDDDEDEEE